MEINLANLASNKQATEKYKKRQVKVFNKSKNLWFKDTSYCIKKENATVFVLEDIMHRLISNSASIENIDIYFVSLVGENKADIKEFDLEEVNLCTSVIWDSYKTKNGH